MADTDYYLDAYSSVVKRIQDCREALMEEGITDEIAFRDLDGHAEDHIIENIDYLFIKDFSGEVDYHFQSWVFNIGVSTFNDENLFRHHKIVNFILKNFLVTDTIPLYDNETAKRKKGHLIVKGSVMVQPMSKYNTRAVQYLLVNVESTETVHERQLLDRI